jgi:hypothetical protein
MLLLPVNSTRYPVAAAEFFEELARWSSPALGYVVEALSKRLVDVGPRGDVEKALVCYVLADIELGFHV